jgi:hypothetical protein
VSRNEEELWKWISVGAVAGGLIAAGLLLALAYAAVV